MRTIPRNNGFPLQIIHNLKNKLILKAHKNKIHSHKHNEKMDHIWILKSKYTQSYQSIKKYRLKHSLSSI